MDALLIANHVPSWLEELGSENPPATHEPPVIPASVTLLSEVLWVWIGGRLEAKMSTSIKRVYEITVKIH